MNDKPNKPQSDLTSEDLAASAKAVAVKKETKAEGAAADKTIFNRELPGVVRKRKHIVGRGLGSKSGQKCGRGQKGHGARSGFSQVRGFEGGQNPLVRRLPKVGFSNEPHRKSVAEIHAEDIFRVFDDGASIEVAELRKRKMVKGEFDVVKVLLKSKDFSSNKKFNFSKQFAFSKSAAAVFSIENPNPMKKTSTKEKLKKKSAR